MAIASESNIQAARKSFETLTDSALARLRSGGNEARLCQRFAGGGSGAIEIVMPGAVPAFKRWTDEADFGGVRMYKKTLPLEKYKAAIELRRDSVVYDQSGAVGQALRQLTGDVGYLWEKLCLEKLDDNPTGLDGVALLSNSHPFGNAGATWDNLGSAGFTFDAYDSARAAMESLTDEYGEPLDIKPSLIIVHPNDQRAALEVAQADYRPVSVGTAGAINTAGVGGSAVSNVYRGTVDVLVTSRITSGNWFVLDERRSPLALGVWRDPEAIVSDDMSGDERQRRDMFRYAVEADAAVCGLQPWGLYGYVA